MLTPMVWISQRLLAGSGLGESLISEELIVYNSITISRNVFADGLSSCFFQAITFVKFIVSTGSGISSTIFDKEYELKFRETW